MTDSLVAKIKTHREKIKDHIRYQKIKMEADKASNVPGNQSIYLTSAALLSRMEWELSSLNDILKD